MPRECLPPHVHVQPEHHGRQPPGTGTDRSLALESIHDAAYDYEDMHHLVSRLAPTQVRRLRLLLTQDEELSQVAEAVSQTETPAGRPHQTACSRSIGSIDGPQDLAERHDDYIRDRMRERFSNPT